MTFILMACITLTIGSCKERKSQSTDKDFSSKSQIAEVDSVNRGMFGGIYLDSSRYRQMGFSSYLQFYEFQNYVTDLKMGLVKSDRTFKGNSDAIAYAQHTSTWFD